MFSVVSRALATRHGVLGGSIYAIRTGFVQLSREPWDF